MLILASASKRRQQLLTQIAVDYTCMAVNIDESREPNEPCCDYVVRVAHAKAEAAQATCAPQDIILAADTTVCLDGEVFGKPVDKDAAKSCLQKLSGKTHQVLSAVVLCQGDSKHVKLSSSNVQFKDLQDDEINWWLAHEQFADKAGAYAIQGASGFFVERIEGSYSGVVGLPLFETTELLRHYQLWPPQA